MVGGAGRDGGMNHIYFAPHLANDFGFSALMVGTMMTAISIGSIVGPIVFGWLSDKLSVHCCRRLWRYPASALYGWPISGRAQ